MRYTLTDPRTENVSAENLTFSLTPDPIQQTFTNQKEDGTIEDVIINIPQPSYETTIKDLQAKLESITRQIEQDQVAISEAQARLIEDTDALTEFQVLIDAMKIDADEAIAPITEI
jgi:phosphoenolpyruvate-protein kinase (PTS system EI component)